MFDCAKTPDVTPHSSGASRNFHLHAPKNIVLSKGENAEKSHYYNGRIIYLLSQRVAVNRYTKYILNVFNTAIVSSRL